jgi:hypothetical protein
VINEHAREPRGNVALIVGNEVVKGLQLGWSERLQILIEMPLFVSFVLLLGYIVGTGDQILTAGHINWNASHGVQADDLVLKRAEPLGDLLAELIDELLKSPTGGCARCRAPLCSAQ